MTFPRRRWSYGIRTLFVLMTTTTVACYSCWLGLPTIMAYRFINALAGRRWWDAEDLFSESPSFPGGLASQEQLEWSEIRLVPLTMSDIRQRVRHITVDVSDENDHGKMLWRVSIDATPAGLKLANILDPPEPAR